jgi:hypothetical protein
MYTPEKRYFTEHDFEQMDWKDNAIHAIVFGPGPEELMLDIDYIFKWDESSGAEPHSGFLVSPATLVFEGVSQLKASYSGFQLAINGITREELNRLEARSPKRLWKWQIACSEGEWEFCATGFRQFIRRPPELVGHRRLKHGERGGYDLMGPNP